jgi:hypothetical protein
MLPIGGQLSYLYALQVARGLRLSHVPKSWFQVARLDPDARYDADVTELQKHFLRISNSPPGPECPPILSHYLSLQILGINTSFIDVGSFWVRLIIKSPDGEQRWEHDVPVFNSGFGPEEPEPERQTMSVEHIIDIQKTPIVPGDRLFFNIIASGRGKTGERDEEMIVEFGTPVATMTWLVY